jgi:uncharacterized protein
MMNGEDKKGKEKANLEIQLAELKDGGLRLCSALSTEWLKKRMHYCEYSAEPISANTDLMVEPAGNGVLLQGWVKSVLSSRCGTCLKEIIINIHADISSFLLPRSEAMNTGDDVELTPEDLDREFFDGDTIVLDDIIGDAVMLEMPMNPKCAGECKGLEYFSTSAEHSQVDPRLAPLMGIRINKEN